jgi:hypothetical protein
MIYGSPEVVVIVSRRESGSVPSSLEKYRSEALSCPFFAPSTGPGARLIQAEG